MRRGLTSWVILLFVTAALMFMYAAYNLHLLRGKAKTRLQEKKLIYDHRSKRVTAVKEEKSPVEVIIDHQFDVLENLSKYLSQSHCIVSLKFNIGLVVVCVIFVYFLQSNLVPV